MPIEELQRGVMNNPFHIIGASEKIGPDAIIVENTSAGAGIVAQAIGANKIIMDTGYFPANTFLGPMRTECIFYSNVTGSDVLTLEVWRKNPAGFEEIIFEGSQDYHGDISPNFGQGFAYLFYTMNNQYRFVFKSATGNAASTTVGIDFMRLTPRGPFDVAPKYQYSGEGANYGAPWVYAIDWGYNTCASAGNAGFTLNVTTGYDCTGDNLAIVVSPKSTGAGATMPLWIISAVSTTGFSIYMQPAGGGNFANNVTLMWNIIWTGEMTKV